MNLIAVANNKCERYFDVLLLRGPEITPELVLFLALLEAALPVILFDRSLETTLEFGQNGSSNC